MIKQKIPVWIIVWGSLMALLPLVFVGIGYFYPAYYGEEWAANDIARFGGVFGNYVARNMASGLIVLIALSQKSAQMLIIAFFMRIFSDLFDVFHNTLTGTIDTFYILDASVLIIISSIAIFKLWNIGSESQ
jgi:hypothetical protein